MGSITTEMGSEGLELCLLCRLPVSLENGLAVAVKDDSGEIIGYVHALCEPEWNEMLAGNQAT